jgi:dihydroorotate dehydrogenase electron transfer subunit
LKKKKLKTRLLYGGRTKKHIYGVKEFKQNGCEVFVATEDGSVGATGFVSKLFDKIATDPATTFIYTCGPTPMMAAVQEFAKTRHLRGQASCEERMACGLGACLGCAVKTTSGYKTACYDGPVFDLAEIVF